MKIMIRLQILMFSIVITFCSCNGSFTDKLSSRVDSLNTALSQTEDRLKLIDLEEIKAIHNTVVDNCLFLSKEYKDTIVDKEMAFFMSDYRVTRKSLDQMIKTYVEQQEAIGFARNQIVDLKKDLNNNLMDEGKFVVYFESESRAVNALEGTVDNLNVWKQSTLAKFKEQNPVVEKFIKDYKDRHPETYPKSAS